MKFDEKKLQYFQQQYGFRRAVLQQRKTIQQSVVAQRSTVYETLAHRYAPPSWARDKPPPPALPEVLAACVTSKNAQTGFGLPTSEVARYVELSQQIEELNEQIKADESAMNLWGNLVPRLERWADEQRKAGN